ncbi:TPA: hypothetical protein U1237_001255 [Streptococcus suis]|nr:hypothetical protein [Streptococcus suis]HEM5061198.1 hypothetical protein [Streptococcus suis]HEM5064587.1 hypothetical protein [Streptococcus suis]
MIDQLAYSAANHFGELETSFILGRRRGQEEGRAEKRILIRYLLYTLGMLVAIGLIFVLTKRKRRTK